MKHLLYLTFGLLFLFTSCNDEEKDVIQDVDLNFKLVYDGEPLVMFEEYIYPSGEKMLFNRYSFYLTDVALKYAGGENQIAAVEYLNFTNQNSTLLGAKEGITMSFNDLEELDYTELAMSIGVNAVDNGMMPADFTSDNDLSKTSEYWPNWASYVFTKTEGQIDFGGPQMSGFSLHTGGNEAKVDFNASLSGLASAEENTVVITIDLKDYFGKENVYDIKSYPSLHTLAQKPQVLELSNNLKNALTFSMR